MDAQDEMYGGGGPTLSNPAPGSDESKQSPDESQTYLINKDVCPGMKVGDEMVVKIVGIHEKEYAVSYLPEPEKEKGVEQEGMAPEAPEGAREGGMAGASDSMYG